ncbi:integral membrane protein S linking to the trans golgi network domain-containing protein [Ditylenchus destructor]|nr:integral membrane protein S linking to the trans golgi network domain-containing protein [Ditylenchus destructor]
MSTFRVAVWDPVLLVGQMMCLQSVFYTIESFLMFSWSFNGAYRPNLDHIFNVQTMRPMTVIQLITSIAVAFAISVLVGRAKQCLDFACTLHFWHIIVSVIYNWQFPTQFTWWLLQLVSVSVCTVLAEWLCMRKETLEIPLSMPSSSKQNET